MNSFPRHGAASSLLDLLHFFHPRIMLWFELPALAKALGIDPGKFLARCRRGSCAIREDVWEGNRGTRLHTDARTNEARKAQLHGL